MKIIDPTFPKRFFSALSELRATKQFCDIALRCGDEVIYAHKAVLSACSPFFKAMFQDEFAESKQEEIDLRHDTNCTIMSAIIDYMYSGEFSISLKNVALLLNNLDYLQMEEAKEQVERLAAANVNVENCIELFVQADLISKTSLEVLHEETLRCIADNLHEIFNSAEFKDLTVEYLLQIFPEVSNTKADTTYKAIMNWIRHDLETRGIYFERLLNNVSIEHLTRSEIHSSILNDEALRNSTFGIKWLSESFLGKKSPLLLKVLHIFQSPNAKIFEFDVGRKSLRSTDGQNLSIMSITKYRNEFYVVDAPNYNLFKLEENTYNIIDLSLKSMPMCSLCAGYDRVYVIGGTNVLGYPLSSSLSCSSYDCEQNEVIDIADMLNGRKYPGVAFYNSALYVFGGNDSNIVERFDPREGHWCIAGKVPLQSKCSATTLANSIYCLGGNLIINYDPRTEISNFIKNHEGNSITALDGRLYLGHNLGIEEYVPSTNNWNTALEYNFASPYILA